MYNNPRGSYRNTNWYKNRVEERKRLNKRNKVIREYKKSHETEAEKRKKRRVERQDRFVHRIWTVITVFGFILLLYIFGAQIIQIIERRFGI